MRLRNVGGLPLRRLALVVGHPEAACPATDANMRRPLLECLAGDGTCAPGQPAPAEPPSR